MKALVFVILTLSLQLSVCNAQSIAPVYVIDLDADPSVRWNQVVSDYKQDFVTVMQYFDKLIPPDIQALIDPILADLDTYIPAPYADEMRGIAAAGAPDINLGQIVTVNLIYELTAFCTSIIAQTNNNTMLHGRNLDYNIPGLRALTIQVDFQSQNQTLFHGVTWAGYVGLLTGMKPGLFAYTVDERDTPGGMADNLYAMLVHRGGSVGFNLRDSLQTHTSYNQALQFVSTVQLMAPVYIIVSGVGNMQGAVVTRDREFALDVWPLGITATDDNGDPQPDPSAWYRVQTNYDRWTTDPVWDRRRIPAQEMMQSVGQHAITLSGIFTILSTPPMFNDNTVYTALMSSALDELITYVRWDAPNATKPFNGVGRWHV